MIRPGGASWADMSADKKANVMNSVKELLEEESLKKGEVIPPVTSAEVKANESVNLAMTTTQQMQKDNLQFMPSMVDKIGEKKKSISAQYVVHSLQDYRPQTPLQLLLKEEMKKGL